MDWFLIGAIVAAILAGVALFESRGRAVVAWAVLALCAGILAERL